MSTFILPSVVAREALMILSNNLVATNLVSTSYASEWEGAKKGDTITIRKPASFRIDEFTSTTNPQGVTETSTTLKLEKIFDATVELTSKELTLQLNDFSTQIVEPLMIDMAQKIDEYILSKYVEVNEYISVDVTTNKVGALAQVNEKLMRMKLPGGARQGLLSPATTTKFLSIDNLVRLDTRGSEGLAGLRDASLGRVMMVDWLASQNVPTHTPGTPGGTPVGTASSGSDVVTVASGGNAGTYVKGDIVTFAGGTETYVVTEDLTLNSSGAGSLKVYPALGRALSGAAITLIAAHDVNLVGNWKAVQFASVPLEMPINNAAVAARMSLNGISIRVVYDYNSSTKKNTVSFDVLAGAKVTDPRLLTRVKVA